MTTSAYQPLTDLEQAFKTIVWDPMIKMGEVWLAGVEAPIPILDLPFIQGLEDWEIQRLTDALFGSWVMWVDINAIKFKNAEMQSKWTESAESLELIAQEKGVGSDAYQQALQTTAIDFANWVHT